MRELHGDVRDLFLAFRIALDPGKMMLGLVGLIFSFAGLAVIAYGGARVGLRGHEWDHFEHALREAEVAAATDLAVTGLGRALCGDVPDARTGRLPSHVAADARRRAAARGQTLPAPPPAWKGILLPGPHGRGANWVGLGLLCAAMLWLSFVWARIGGAIARIAAVEVAKDERLSVNEGLAYAKQHFSAFFWAPISVGLCIAVLLLGNAFLGLVMAALPWLGDLLAIVVLPLAFLTSLVVLFLGVGGAVGWPLMTPAMASEGTDAFDSVSRAMSYVYGHPFRVVGYAIVSKLYGLVSCAVVWAFAFGVVKLTFFSVGLGLHVFAGSDRKFDLMAEYLFGRATGDPSPVTMGEIIAAHGWAAPVMLVALGVLVLGIFGLAAGYAVSYQYTARALVYSLLRKVEDQTEQDEVWLPEDEDPGANGDDEEGLPSTPPAGDGTAADPNAGLDAAQQQAAQEARAAGGPDPTVGESPA